MQKERKETNVSILAFAEVGRFQSDLVQCLKLGFWPCINFCFAAQFCHQRIDHSIGKRGPVHGFPPKIVSLTIACLLLHLKLEPEMSILNTFYKSINKDLLARKAHFFWLVCSIYDCHPELVKCFVHCYDNFTSTYHLWKQSKSWRQQIQNWNLETIIANLCCKEKSWGVWQSHQTVFVFRKGHENDSVVVEETLLLWISVDDHRQLK